jgi:hypothetical protein
MSAPHRLGFWQRALASVLALAALSGCGPQFDPPSEVKTLRVLGVKKDKPYAQPGDTVKLSLLWDDAKGRDASEIQRVFVGGCVNPPGDLYYGCFAQFGQASGGLPPFGMGDSFQVTLPSDIISARPGLEPGQPRYGVYIVFFAVCAGQISFDMSQGQSQGGSTGLPIRCLDKAGNALGSDDFLVGYSSIYSFEDVSNKNPELELDKDGQGQWLVAGKSVVADCVGESCQGAPAVDVDCKATPERCVDTCADDGDPKCPAVDVQPQILQDVEKDDVSSKLFGTDVTEQMWVNYYVDHGSISNARLLNDTTSGWNAQYRAQLRAPKDAGNFQVWAVVHDNRGGMEFGRVTLRAR